MSEESLVASLVSTTINFPWKTTNKILWTTELKITKNRVDIVYFEKKQNHEIGFVIAVEAKLKNWRRAIAQAYRDRLFADRVYVALPAAYASSAIANISEFRQASVGLIILDGKIAKVFYHPKINTQRSSYHLNAAKISLNAFIPKDCAKENRTTHQGVKYSLEPVF